MQNLRCIAPPTQQLDITLALSKAYWSVAPAKGLHLADTAIQMAILTGNREKEAKAWLYGGVNYWAMGEYDKALNYYDRCLRIAESIDNQKLEAFAMNNIGMIYHEIGDYKNAMTQFEKSLFIMKTLDDKIETAKIINSIGKLNTDMQSFDDALNNYQTVVDLIKNTSERKLYLWVLNDIGEVYSRLSQPDKAIDYFEQALKIADELNDQAGKAMVYNNIGHICLNKKKFAEARTDFRKAADYAQNAKAREQLMSAWENLSDLHHQKGEYKPSLEYYKLFKQMSDSIYNENKLKNIINIQTRYETETKEKEIELLRKDAELNRLRISKQNLVRNFLIALLLVVVMLTLIIFGRLQMKKKANVLLAGKNEVINKQKAELAEITDHLKQTNAVLEEQKKEIQQHVEALREANNTKDKFFTIIAHDLKSPFNTILGFSYLLADQVREKDYDGIEEYAMYIQNSSQLALDLLMNLLEWARLQTGKVEYNPKSLEIVSLIDEVVELLNDTARQKQISITRDLPPNITVFADREMIGAILRNLISNAIKYTNPCGKIVILAEQKQCELKISISDNGVGIDDAAINPTWKS